MGLSDFIKVLCARFDEARNATVPSPQAIGPTFDPSKPNNEESYLLAFTLWYITHNVTRGKNWHFHAQYGTTKDYDISIYHRIMDSPLADGTLLRDMLFPFPGIAIEKYATAEFVGAYSETIGPKGIWDSSNRAIGISICKFITQNAASFAHVHFDDISTRYTSLQPLNSLELVEVSQSIQSMLSALDQAKEAALANSSYQDVWIAGNHETLVRTIDSLNDIKNLIKAGSSHTFNIQELAHDIEALDVTPVQRCQLFFIAIGYGVFDVQKLTKLPLFITAETLKATIESKDMQNFEASYKNGIRNHVLFIKEENKLAFCRKLSELALPLSKKRGILIQFAPDYNLSTRLLEAATNGARSMGYHFYEFFRISFGTGQYNASNIYYQSIFSHHENAYKEIKQLCDALPLLYLTKPQVDKLHELKSYIVDALEEAFKKKFESASTDDKIEGLLLLTDALATDDDGTPSNILSQIIITSRGPVAAIGLTKLKLESTLKTAVEKLYKIDSAAFSAWVEDNRREERAKLVCTYYDKNLAGSQATGSSFTNLWKINGSAHKGDNDDSQGQELANRVVK